jgi:hypothetical protein
MCVSKFTTKNRVTTWPPDSKSAAEAASKRKALEGKGHRRG